MRIESVEWATTNSIPNLGGTATFQPTPYIYDNAQNTNLIQWTTVTGGISGNTAAGVCPEGWRLPTQTEYQELYEASSIGNIAGFNGSWSTINGVNGLTLTTPSGSLFFAASGYRKTSGTLDTQGTHGYYWSSTVYTAEAEAAYCLFFHNGGYVTPAGGGGNTRYYSVRCVRDAGVVVGNVVWARTNSIPNLGGTATFQPTPYVYDNVEHHLNWNQATGGISGNTAAGVCPPNWRLPTNVEYQALYNASAVGNIPGYRGAWSTINGINGLVLSPPNGSLFFPASGYVILGTFVGLSTSGVYRSSTEHSEDNAFVVYFTNAAVYTGSGNEKTDLYPIRCVRNI